MKEAQPSDGNVALILSPAQRREVSGFMEAIVGSDQGEYAILVDRAGRIADIAHRPEGVPLAAVSSLAAGCYATTSALANEIGEVSYALRFESEDEQQVYIRMLTDRALFVGVARNPTSARDLVGRLEGSLGKGFIGVLNRAAMPRQASGARMIPREIPADVRRRTRALTAFISDVYNFRSEKINRELRVFLLTSRDDLMRVLSANDWTGAKEICERIRQWLIKQLDFPNPSGIGPALSDFYTEVFSLAHRKMRAWVGGGKVILLYRSFFGTLSKKWPRVFSVPDILSSSGVNVAAAWSALERHVSDPLEAAEEFVPAMDALVRSVLRVGFLTKGPHAAQEMLLSVLGTKESHRDSLISYGLDGSVGDTWTDLMAE